MQKTDRRLPETREENLQVLGTTKGSRELSSLQSQGTQTLGLMLSTAKSQKLQHPRPIETCNTGETEPTISKLYNIRRSPYPCFSGHC